MRNLNPSAFMPSAAAAAAMPAVMGSPSPRARTGKVMVSLRVPDDLRRRFYAEAAAQDRRKEECLAEALELWLDRQSGKQDFRIS